MSASLRAYGKAVNGSRRNEFFMLLSAFTHRRCTFTSAALERA